MQITLPMQSSSSSSPTYLTVRIISFYSSFIGELFKLQMLTDTIMYDCIEYLLRDKTDEESLECLCRLLRTIGKELEGKASEKVRAAVRPRLPHPHVSFADFQ